MKTAWDKVETCLSTHQPPTTCPCMSPASERSLDWNRGFCVLCLNELLKKKSIFQCLDPKEVISGSIWFPQFYTFSRDPGPSSITSELMFQCQLYMQSGCQVLRSQCEAKQWIKWDVHFYQETKQCWGQPVQHDCSSKRLHTPPYSAILSKWSQSDQKPSTIVSLL